MTVEHKFISLAEFKAITDGPGGFAGYMSKHGELDDGGDIVAKGAHVDTIPQFLKHGFASNNHDWTFGNLYGYPIKAFEDEVGTWVEMRFHSTADSQAARVKAQERMAAGLDVRMSIGYQPSVSPLIIEPKDYASVIPQYSKPELIQSNIEKASRFPFVRVLLKNDLFEGALVSVPMLASASVSAVKSLLDGLGTGNVEYSEHARLLVTAIGEFMGRTEARAEMRTKEGRVFSSANMSDLESMASQLEDMATRMRAMMEAAKPKPKQAEALSEEAKQQLITEVLIGMALRDAARIGVTIR